MGIAAFSLLLSLLGPTPHFPAASVAPGSVSLELLPADAAAFLLPDPGPAATATGVAPSLPVAPSLGTVALQTDPALSGRNPRSALSVVYYDYYDTEFRIADVDQPWDQAQRWELNFLTRGPVRGRVESMVGAYVFFDDREYDKGIASVQTDTWGFGVEFGAMLYPGQNASERPLNIGIMPFLRLGMGFDDGKFRNLPIALGNGDIGLTSGDLGNLRFEGGVGAEVRAVLNRKLFAGLGAGYNWWTTADGAVGQTRNGTIIVVAEDELDFSGDEAYVRLSIGLMF